MVGGDTDKLYTLHAWTGAATAIGSVTAFGAVNETEPRGLAALDGALYMVGAVNDALYTLDTSSGVASQVGSATQFGVSEGAPTGIAAHNGMLYMTGADTDALYTLDTTTGVATQVGSATQFDASEGGPNGLAWHRGTLYMVSSETDRLYWINSTSGVATAIGSATAFGVSEGSPSGLASHPPSGGAPSDLYMVGSGTDKLWTLNTEDGAAEGVEAQNPPFGAGSSIRMASDNEKLYLFVHKSHSIDLYTYDPSTGVSMLIGSVSNPDTTDYYVYSCAWHSGTLYTALGYRNNPEHAGLYAVNTDTAELTPIGDTSGFGVGDSASAIASHGGTLYMVGRKLYKLDTKTGVGTAVSNQAMRTAYGLSSHNGVLYMIGLFDIFTVDTTTGVLSEGVNFSTGQGEIISLASHKGTLYTIRHEGGTVSILYTLNPTTGKLTRVPSALSQFGVGEGDPQGLASGP